MFAKSSKDILRTAFSGFVAMSYSSSELSTGFISRHSTCIICQQRYPQFPTLTRQMVYLFQTIIGIHTFLLINFYFIDNTSLALFCYSHCRCSDQPLIDSFWPIYFSW
ncbi:unnamed protein product [Protopolystoma xenopodis]|uniref:Uncharacterized protein n=1 Tax=Protopolystoma xenopodis TaxID=117903 RepID=A0A448XLT9_9PLAT|nr:unnamed protein product [Protopolystoma xenopodis]